MTVYLFSQFCSDLALLSCLRLLVSVAFQYAKFNLCTGRVQDEVDRQLTLESPLRSFTFLN